MCEECNKLTKELGEISAERNKMFQTATRLKDKGRGNEGIEADKLVEKLTGKQNAAQSRLDSDKATHR